MAPCLLLLWDDARVYGIGFVPSGANAGSADVFLGAMLLGRRVGSHECGCCIPIAHAAGWEEEEEQQLCFSILE